MQVRRRLSLLAIFFAIVSSLAAAPYLRTLLYLRHDAGIFPIAPVPPHSPAVELPLSDPRSDRWRFVNVFPGLGLDSPTVALFLPDSRVLVLERAGRIWTVKRTSDGGVAKQLLVDFTAKVGTIEGEEGAVGMALHPDFGKATVSGHYLFVYYTSRSGARMDRLERLSFDGTFQSLVPSLATTLIDQRDEHTDHNGGDLHFGPDGFLYVSIGDEGSCNCGNAQRIDKDLFSGILRIDPDERGGTISHAPPRQPRTGRTAHYFIPNDNPFVGEPGALEEFWSIGLRNPYRFSIDGPDRLIGGDVGWVRVESVFEATKGSNHRWPRFEGNLEHRNLDNVPTKIWGRETPPLFTYVHESLNCAIIGGLVYRGKALPELEGRYIYGDNCSGRVWALDLTKRESVQVATLADRSDQGLSGFARDADGEIYALTLGAPGLGAIRKLTRADPGTGEKLALPKTLSEIGFFADVRTATAAKGSWEYAINLPMWNGIQGVSQRNWAFSLRALMVGVRFSSRAEWAVPGGMVFVKHLALGGRPIETQFLVASSATAGYGLTYEWNSAGTDADLVEKSKDVPVAGGTWHFGESSECLVCHSKAAGLVLGVNTRQLNRQDQLVRLRKQGFFMDREALTSRMWSLWQPLKFVNELLRIHRELQDAPLVQPSLLHEYPRLLRPEDAGPVEPRVRSYLDANCGHCHRPGGSGGGRFDARYGAPLTHGGIVGVAAQRSIDDAQLLIAPGSPERSLIFKRISSDVPGVRMPPIVVSAHNPRAVDLFRSWIKTL